LGDKKEYPLGSFGWSNIFVFFYFYNGNSYFTPWEVKGNTLWEALNGPISLFFLSFYNGNSYFTLWEGKGSTLWEALGGPISCISFPFMMEIATSSFGRSKGLWEALGGPISLFFFCLEGK